MSTMTNQDFYRKGLELAEAGRHNQALEYIQRHLRTAPDDVEAINDAGAILHCLGRSAEAVDYFSKARNLKPDSAEIVWNLAEAYLAVAKPEQTAHLLDDMEQLGILNPDLLNRTANVFLNQDNKSDALEMLLRSLQIAPGQRVLAPMVEVIRSKRPKIAFFCGLKGDVKFLKDIYAFTEHRFPVRFFDGNNVEQMYELMKWSDISWFEWCTNIAVDASKLPKVCKNIVRLHRFEVHDGDWPARVQWENIDTLITVGTSYVEDALLAQVPDITSRTCVVNIRNGVNLDTFGFTDRPRGKNIAYVGYLNLIKNPMFLLQCMQKLHYIDPEYRLYLAGVFQERVLEQYVSHMIKALDLEDVVFFDGWQNDVAAWLHDKHYIVSTSVFEGQGMGVLEGMACGLKPIIHNFPGAEETFPPQLLFNLAEDFCRHICSESYEPWEYRRFVEDRYPLQEQLNQINRIFTDFETQIQQNEMSMAC